MYKVDISKEAQREIRKLPPDEIPGIGKKIHTLIHEPRPSVRYNKVDFTAYNILYETHRNRRVGEAIRTKSKRVNRTGEEARHSRNKIQSISSFNKMRNLNKMWEYGRVQVPDERLKKSGASEPLIEAISSYLECQISFAAPTLF